MTVSTSSSHNFEVVDHGTGEVKPAQTTVHVPSYEIFNDIVSGTLDGWEAYKNGTVTVTGNGLINNLKNEVPLLGSKICRK